MRALNSVDLPTFGRPTSATRSGPSSSRPRGRRLVVAGVEGCDDRVEEVAGAPAVQGAHRDRLAEPEGANSQIARSAVSSSTLFTTSRTGRPAALDEPRRREVLLGHPDGDVDHEQHEVGAVERAGGLFATTLSSSVVPAGQPAAGVDDVEGDARPLGGEDLAVPRDARAAPRRRRCDDRRAG